jgi:hypothetical protein
MDIIIMMMQVLSESVSCALVETEPQKLKNSPLCLTSFHWKFHKGDEAAEKVPVSIQTCRWF